MNPFPISFALLLVLLIILPAALAGSAPTCRSLERPVPAPRWLSAPRSRIVVNPYLPAQVGMEGISTDMAVYAGEYPLALPDAWSWRFGPGDGGATGVVDGPAPEMASAAWNAVDVTPSLEDGGVRLTLGGAPYGSLTARVTVDLDRTPFLALDVSDVEGAWALKVAPDGPDDRDESGDITLRMDTPEPGRHAFDVRRATGWTGERTFRVRLFVVGGEGRGASVSGLRFFGPARSEPATEIRERVWAPDRLTVRAAGPDRRALEVRTGLSGEGTVWQTVRVGPGGASTLILTGKWPRGEGSRVNWDARGGFVSLESRGVRARLAASGRARWLGVFSTWEDYLAGKGSPEGAGGLWAIALDGVDAGSEVALRADFAPAGATREDARPIPNLTAARAALSRAESEWNARLARVPRPLDFPLSRVDPKGLTADDLRRSYYDAWALVFADILPPMPENGYPYPQVACGKPSLWSEGHPKARASAQWESIIGMQFLALADPQTAWQAYAGLMTLVDTDGTMNGEGLPSWHMQTAWTLYALTGDPTRLRAAWPAMERLLRWKMADPRWIHKGATREGSKDAEFVVHALLDADYAARIARAIKMEDDAAAWQARRKDLAEDYRRWFFAPPGHTAYRIHDADGGRSGPDNPWSLPGIALPPDILGEPERGALLRLFDRLKGGEDTFLIGNFTKHPHYALAARGLWQYGRRDDLVEMTETYIRDVARAGEFAEQYVQDAPPVPDGVRPSLFGALIVIEAALWRNGVTFAEGYPALARVPGASGVENLRVRGAVLDVRLDADGVALSGAALRALERPAGFTAATDGTPRWRGVLPEAGLVVLTPAARSNMATGK